MQALGGGIRGETKVNYTGLVQVVAQLAPAQPLGDVEIKGCELRLLPAMDAGVKFNNVTTHQTEANPVMERNNTDGMEAHRLCAGVKRARLSKARVE